MSRGFSEAMRTAREEIAAYLKTYSRAETALHFGTSLGYVDQTARMFNLTTPKLDRKKMISTLHFLIHTDLTLTEIANKVKYNLSNVAGIYRDMKKQFPEMKNRKIGRPKKTIQKDK